MRRQQSAEYRGYRTAGIRLTEDPLPLGDKRGATFAEMADAIHWFDKAHLVMLAEEGLIPPSAGAAMLSALLELEPDLVLATRLEVGGATHSGENYLIRRLGEEIGGQLHLGRSSGDLAEVGLRVTMRKYLLQVLADLVSFRQEILPLSATHDATVMPGYTHGQQAQPTTYGHWVAMWAQVLARDFERLSQLYERVNLSPAGAAILTGTDFPLDRHRTARLLGFTAPLANTLDAIHSHDIQLEYISSLAVHASNMGRLADDILLWASSEFGFVRVPDRYCSTSSIMMQKRNPQAPQATKAIAAMATGAITIACMSFKGSTGLPIHERGFVEGQLWSVSDEVSRSLRWWTELLPALTVNTDRMRELAGAHWAQATDLAGTLVRERTMGWRTAHQIVGILCRLAEERDLSPAQATPELLDEAAIEYMGEPVGLSQSAITSALDAVFSPPVELSTAGPPRSRWPASRRAPPPARRRRASTGGPANGPAGSSGSPGPVDRGDLPGRGSCCTVTHRSVPRRMIVCSARCQAPSPGRYRPQYYLFVPIDSAAKGPDGRHRHTHSLVSARPDGSVCQQRWLSRLPASRRLYAVEILPDSWVTLPLRFVDLDLQLEEIHRAGVGTVVSSSASFGDVDLLPLGQARDLAVTVNEERAAAQRRHPGFIGLATVPWQDGSAAVDVLQDAGTRLGLRGALIHSNIGGAPVDSGYLRPAYEKMAELGMHLFLHPGRTLLAPQTADLGLEVMVAYMFDSSLAALRLALSGVLDGLSLQVVHPHCGATLPYLAKRIDGSYAKPWCLGRELPGLRVKYSSRSIQTRCAKARKPSPLPSTFTGRSTCSTAATARTFPRPTRWH